MPVSFFCTIVFAHDSGEKRKRAVEKKKWERERIENLRDRAACTFVCVHNVHRTSGSMFFFSVCLFVCCVCACTCKYYVTTAGKKKNVVRELSIFSLPQQEACCIRTTRLYSIPSSASKWFCSFVKFVICARIINAQRQFFFPSL